MNRLLILFVCFNILAGCQEPPTVVVNVPAPVVNVTVPPPEVIVVSDDDDSATDDDDSAEPPTPELVPSTFTMFVTPSIGQQPVQVIEGPAGVIMGSIAFTFEGGYQEMYSFPLSIFHRAAYNNVEEPFLNELGGVTGCTLGLPNGNNMELTADGGPGWWVTLPEPFVHNGPESTTVRFDLDCNIDAPTDGDADAYALGVNATAVVAVVDADDNLVDGSLSNNGQWLYPNSPEPSGLYPSFYAVVDSPMEPMAPTLTVSPADWWLAGLQIPQSNLTPLRFNVTAEGDDWQVYGADLNVYVTDIFYSSWSRCGGPLGQPDGIRIRNADDPSTTLGNFSPAPTSAGTCADNPGSMIGSANNGTMNTIVPMGTTVTFEVLVDASWAAPSASELLQVGLAGMTASNLSGAPAVIQGIPLNGAIIWF